MLPDDPLIGRQLANFKIERAIGRGGMAQVYYGQDVKLQRPVAIKVIDARYRSNPSYAHRFVREAQAVAQWRHEHIIQIYYADDEAGLYYFVMEFIDGSDLGALLAQYGARHELMPAVEVVRLGGAIGSALDYAHQRHVIHRDVKPSNVMVARDGRIVLADFGLAMDVEQGSMGEVFGSPRYIAPEQARRSSDAVAQSDLYALGVILYEMLTGRVPFDDPSSTVIAIQHLTMPPPPPRELNPDLSEAVEAVLLKALNKEPKARYQSGRELIAALSEALQLDRGNLLSPAQPGAVLMAADGVSIAQGQPADAAAKAGASRGRATLAYVALGSGLLIVLGVMALSLIIALYFWQSSSSKAGQPAQEATAVDEPRAGVGQVSLQEKEPGGGEANAPQLSQVEAGGEDRGQASGETMAAPSETSQPTPIEPVAMPATPIPTETPQPTPTAPVEAPATAAPEIMASYGLLIARQGQDGLFVVNQGHEPFPLFSLRLGNDKGLIDGPEWVVSSLENGDCVAAWKGQEEKGDDDAEEKKRRPPKAARDCRLVGESLFFEEKESFWKEDFAVFYNGDLIEICPEKEDQCAININDIR